jgi:phosphatidate cytidylyltransferase
MALLSAVASYEMLRCLGYDKKPSIFIPTLLFSLLSPCTPLLFDVTGDILTLFLILISGFMYYLFILTIFDVGRLNLGKVAEVFFTVSYVTGGFVSMNLLRGTNGGTYITILVLLGAWMTDVCAYLTGRFFGKHKLMPQVSPQKTVEGAVGGLVFSSIAFIIFGLVVGALTDMRSNSLTLALFGIVVSVVAQFGDLAMSAVKRQHNIKDYGFILPGHGGILDRFDSVVSVSPLMLLLSLYPDWLRIFF